jgi:hypothetical protein
VGVARASAADPRAFAGEARARAALAAGGGQPSSASFGSPALILSNPTSGAFIRKVDLADVAAGFLGVSPVIAVTQTLGRESVDLVLAVMETKASVGGVARGTSTGGTDTRAAEGSSVGVSVVAVGGSAGTVVWSVGVGVVATGKGRTRLRSGATSASFAASAPLPSVSQFVASTNDPANPRVAFGLNGQVIALGLANATRQ